MISFNELIFLLSKIKEPNKAPKVEQEESEEEIDPVELILKRIIYAEGDVEVSKQQKTSSQFLKKSLPQIVTLLAKEQSTEDYEKGILDIVLLRYVFLT